MARLEDLIFQNLKREAPKAPRSINDGGHANCPSRPARS